MPLTETEILSVLMKSRDRVSAAAWFVVHDAQAAEDIFQNVALKAMTRSVVFEHEGAILSWAFITARNEGVDWLRKHKRETCGLESGVIDLLEKTWLEETSQKGNARTEALRDCIERLPMHSRQLMKLRYFDGMSCGEVAESLNAGLNAVYKRISRVHQGLKDCIEAKLARS